MTGPVRRLAWREATIVSAEPATPRVRGLRLAVGWERLRAGQHLDLRLTAPDGYQAQRSYSIASSPEDPGTVEILVERLDDGEVSGFLHDIAEPGDTIEVRGPIGAPFTWSPEDGGPLLLLGGGTGVAPLLAMLRHRAAASPAIPAALVYSARTRDEVIAREELLAWAVHDAAFHLALRLTREPDGAGRIDRGVIESALAALPGPPAHAFICGSNRFVGPMADLLVDIGIPAERIRTERFGG